MYNVVISDLDGTLLSSDHQIDKETLKVVRKLVENKIQFIIATGRTYIDAKRIIDEINYPIPLIGGNGTQLYDENGKNIFTYMLTKNEVDYIYSLDYKQYGEEIVLSTVTEDEWLVHENLDENHFLKDWTDDVWYYKKRDIKEIDRNNVIKVFFSGSHENLVKIEKNLKEHFKDEVNIAFTLEFCLEVFPKKATKANALIKLAQLKSYDLSNSIAFGDGFNDVEMLRLAKKGCVMANAHKKLKDELKEMEIIGKNSEQGLANKLKEIYKWL